MRGGREELGLPVVNTVAAAVAVANAKQRVYTAA